MTSATIKLFLPRGDAKSLRTAEISNWTGKAVAAPRTELDELLAREELDKAGVYILIGSDPLTNAPRAYIGEARGRRTANGFVVFQGSTAVLEERPSAEIYPYVVAQPMARLSTRTASWSSPRMRSFPIHLRRRLSYTAGAQTDLSRGKLRVASRSNSSTNRPNQRLLRLTAAAEP
jgi:hypothetical protein